MPRQITDIEQRVEVVKLLLEMMHAFNAVYFNGEGAAKRADDMLLIAALLIGQAEGRPLNASKLADFAGMPRPTVIRKMAELERDGIVSRAGGKAFVLRRDHANRDVAVKAAAAIRRRLLAVAAKLSKMDSKGIAESLVLLAVIFDEGVAAAVNTALFLTCLHGP